jgi:hypothetical protein
MFITTVNLDWSFGEYKKEEGMEEDLDDLLGIWGQTD